MGPEGRRDPASLKDLLIEKTGRFEFLQAVRLFQRIWADLEPVGREADPGREVVRFRSDVSSVFPGRDVQEGASPDASDKCGLANRRECYSKVQGQLRQILEDELKYSLGLAAIADGWQDREVVEQLKERGGVWSAMAADFDDDQDFQAEVDLRGTIPWEGQ